MVSGEPYNLRKNHTLLLSILFLVALSIGLILSIVHSSSAYNNELTGAVISTPSDVPKGYAPPWNIFTPGNETFLTVTTDNVTNDKLPVTTTVAEDGLIIYKTYYTSKGDSWIPHTFPQGTIGSSEWISGQAEKKVLLDMSDLKSGNDNYAIVYVCTRVEGEWKCGCKTPDNCGLWSIQDFKKPDEVPPPGDPQCNGKADGDRFCDSENPNTLYTCDNTTGTMVVEETPCEEGYICNDSTGIANCTYQGPTCGVFIPSGNNYDCGTTNQFDNCGETTEIIGTRCDEGFVCDNSSEPATCVPDISPPSNPGNTTTCEEGENQTATCPSGEVYNTAVCYNNSWRLVEYAPPGPCNKQSLCPSPECYDTQTDSCVSEMKIGEENKPADGVGELCVDGEWGPTVPLN